MTHEPTAPDLEKFLGRETNAGARRIEYVASPYWHPRREVRQARARAAVAGATLLMQRNVVALSPVVYSSTIQEQGNFSPPEGWYEFDLNFLSSAGGMTILEIPGWERSRGILIELGFARGLGLPIHRVRWEEIRCLLDQETIRVLEEWREESVRTTSE